MVIATREYVALVQREREDSIENHRLARLAACLRACCEPSPIERLARFLGRAPAAC